MAFTYIVINKIINQCVFIIITFDHNAVDVLEVKTAVHGVRDEHDTFLCRRLDEKAVIWHVVSDFKGLDSKSTDERLLSRRKWLYAPN